MQCLMMTNWYPNQVQGITGDQQTLSCCWSFLVGSLFSSQSWFGWDNETEPENVPQFHNYDIKWDKNFVHPLLNYIHKNLKPYY